MTTFRPFRNGDPPALAALWNRGTPATAVARPLKAHEFDALVVGGPLFDRSGLVVAERGGRVIGFAHAGFGPESTTDAPLRLACEMGTVAMLVTDPAVDDPGLDDALFAAAEVYLIERGASVLYAGGQYPLNPFYWGVYGGSEFAGILEGHVRFHGAAARAGYQPVARVELLEVDLSEPGPRDPRAVLTRRQTRLEESYDALLPAWWDSLALSEFRPTIFRLMARGDEVELARVTTWDMAAFGRDDGLSRLGLVDLEVHPGHRRKGYGRFLVGEVLKLAREQGTSAVSVQTRSTNAPALALYGAAGFRPVEAATLYRRPGATG